MLRRHRTGIGIAAADLPQIFLRVFRVDKARSRHDAGAGLGLSLAQWIATAHNAVIEMESELGAGTRFLVVFPAGSGAPLTPAFAQPNCAPTLAYMDSNRTQTS